MGSDTIKCIILGCYGLWLSNGLFEELLVE